MPKSTKVQGTGVYANLCLTVIAGCLVYVCYRITTTDTNPTKVEIVRISSKLDNALGVQFVRGEMPQNRMQVEIVGVASNIQNPLPIKTKQEEKGGLFGSAPSNDGAIAVRLVGIEKPGGQGKWHAIPVRGPATMSGELGGMMGSFPVEVTTGVRPLKVTVR